MPDLTEQEYDTLDELITQTTPKVTGDGKGGFFIKPVEENWKTYGYKLKCRK